MSSHPDLLASVKRPRTTRILRPSSPKSTGSSVDVGELAARRSGREVVRRSGHSRGNLQAAPRRPCGDPPSRAGHRIVWSGQGADAADEPELPLDAGGRALLRLSAHQPDPGDTGWENTNLIDTPPVAQWSPGPLARFCYPELEAGRGAGGRGGRAGGAGACRTLGAAASAGRRTRDRVTTFQRACPTTGRRRHRAIPRAAGRWSTRPSPTRGHTARKHPGDGKVLRDLPAAGTFDQKSNWTLNLKNRPSRTSVGASQLSYAKL